MYIARQQNLLLQAFFLLIWKYPDVFGAACTADNGAIFALAAVAVNTASPAFTTVPSAAATYPPSSGSTSAVVPASCSAFSVAISSTEDIVAPAAITVTAVAASSATGATHFLFCYFCFCC